MSLRFGVIGAGRIAHTFSKAVQAPRCQNATLYAIAARDIDRARAFQSLYGYEKAYGSYEEMLSDNAVDVVYVATPHGLHYEHMKMALLSGKHILCEKAFTLSKRQAEVIFDMAKSRGLFVMEAMWTRFLPLIKDVVTLVNQGEIGTLIGMDATFGFKSDAPDSDRLFDLHLGGGAILDITIYPLTMADLFFGIPKTITSEVVKYKTGSDISDHVELHYDDDVLIVIDTSFKEDLDNTAIIKGTKGTITISNYWGGQQALIKDNSGNEQTISRPFEVNGFEYQIAHVIDMIRCKHIESDVMTPQKTLYMLELMDLIRAQNGIVYPNESI